MVKRQGFFALTLMILSGCDTDPNVKTFFTPGPDCERHIIHELNSSKNTVDIAVYSITNQQITNAIIAAHNRGVQVRVITDRAQAKIPAASTSQLQSAGIDVITNKKHKIMHHKFAIFDGRRVASGSYNLTANATKNNAENCDFFVLCENKYIARFEYLWGLYN